MKVKDLIEQLKEYNADADVFAIVRSTPYPFNISYGGSDGVTKDDTTEVFLFVDTLNESDNIKQ